VVRYLRALTPQFEEGLTLPPACFIRDKDTIGSDEFLGEYVWKWSELTEDKSLVASNHNTASVALQARPGKKDKVSGIVTVRYSFLRDETKQKLQAEATAAQVCPVLWRSARGFMRTRFADSM
jgi:hypothetical protein